MRNYINKKKKYLCKVVIIINYISGCLSWKMKLREKRYILFIKIIHFHVNIQKNINIKIKNKIYYEINVFTFYYLYICL